MEKKKPFGPPMRSFRLFPQVREHNKKVSVKRTQEEIDADRDAVLNAVFSLSEVTTIIVGIQRNLQKMHDHLDEFETLGKDRTLVLTAQKDSLRKEVAQLTERLQVVIDQQI